MSRLCRELMGVNWSLAMPVQTVDEGLYAEDLSVKINRSCWRDCRCTAWAAIGSGAPRLSGCQVYGLRDVSCLRKMARRFRQVVRSRGS
jgi:hypothetical protein